MDADAATPKALFDGHKHYEIPSFQRPYVWTIDDQWEPLWRDVVRVARARADTAGRGVHEHFMGAVVLKDLPRGALDPSKLSVIDGQQRLTTLQILMDACHYAIVTSGVGDSADFAESLSNLISNDASRFKGTSYRFKLWPSRTDRGAFEHAMDDSLTSTLFETHRISMAHAYFVSAARSWIQEPATDEERLVRIAGLTDALQNGLSLVAITLGQNDDDHTIFETLNDRGTPLLKADLIKNWILQSASALSVDADVWADKYWADLDDNWWREEVRQGRGFRSRIDLFLQYWLTMRSEDEILVDDVFRAFREYFEPSLASVGNAELTLEAMRNDANTYRELVTGAAENRVATFHAKVIETLELGAFMPIVLRLLAHGSTISEQQRSDALDGLESWAVRRTVLRQTMQGLNNLIVSLLKHLSATGDDAVGAETVAFLAAQTADARVWPSDDDVVSRLPRLGLYGSIRQPRIRLVLAAVEWSLRSDFVEGVPLPDGLEIEHIMPRGWREHWGDGILGDPEKVVQRESLINTLGNLTLVTKKLNGSLSNRPWTDLAAAAVAPTGERAGKGKRSLLSESSVLMLNKRLVDGHTYEWSDGDIRIRGAQLSEALCALWPRPFVTEPGGSADTSLRRTV